jgi:hypothetical protein
MNTPLVDYTFPIRSVADCSDYLFFILNGVGVDYVLKLARRKFFKLNKIGINQILPLSHALIQSSAKTSPALNFFGALISKKSLDCNVGESLFLGLRRQN